MNVYEIEFLGYFGSDKYDNVLAETFEEACLKAEKLLAKRRRKLEDTEILSIEFLNEITEVKA